MYNHNTMNCSYHEDGERLFLQRELASSVDSYFTPTIDQRLNLRCFFGNTMSEDLASYRRMFSLPIIMFATIQHSDQAAQFRTIQKFMCWLCHQNTIYRPSKRLANSKEWFDVWNIPCWHSLRYRALEDQNYVTVSNSTSHSVWYFGLVCSGLSHICL